MFCYIIGLALGGLSTLSACQPVQQAKPLPIFGPPGSHAATRRPSGSPDVAHGEAGREKSNRKESLSNSVSLPSDKHVFLSVQVSCHPSGTYSPTALT